MFVLGIMIAAAGCGSQTKEPPAPPQGDTQTPPPGEVAGTETPPPATEGSKEPTGELIQCTEESRRAEMCTQQFEPVCGDVDTGVRCIRAPCPASERKTFSNACVACQEAKVMGYRKGSCEGDAKTAP
jgi:hypothetical protein